MKRAIFSFDPFFWTMHVSEEHNHYKYICRTAMTRAQIPEAIPTTDLEQP
jgi:hypothetical protein